MGIEVGFRNYHIHRLDGHYEGKPSWLKYAWARSREEAQDIVDQLNREHPNWKFRIRLAPKRR